MSYRGLLKQLTSRKSFLYSCIQLHDNDWKPAAYCSRRLPDAETGYAQIEKECLASVWACKRFEKYLCGLADFNLPTLPAPEANPQPQWPDLEVVRNKDASEKRKQAFYFKHRHDARPLPSLKPGDPTLIKLDRQMFWQTPAVVTEESVTPRSYVTKTLQGEKIKKQSPPSLTRSCSSVSPLRPH
ncbi:hypothetical protein ACEWY4_009469 [Coilia grayii]|uniref:Reverse transcriptase/retrotransposon-derived protein RNase H-like domain-containing protein n=1 Tax=Coilia grayii TaxID=363190 RepID=A0ABD1K6K2_9TELE